MAPPRVGYMLVPYMRLSAEDRIEVLKQELQEGAQVWSRVPTKINGELATVLACKKWGIIALNNLA